MEPRSKRFWDDSQRCRASLTPQRIAVEVDAKPDVLGPALTAAKPRVRQLPIGLPLPPAEDNHYLLDSDRPVVAAGPASYDEVSPLVA